MTYKNNIKSARKTAGMTQEELADKLNVSSMTISRWEKGEGRIGVISAYKMADLLHVPVNALVGYEVPERTVLVQESVYKELIDIREKYEKIKKVILEEVK